MDRLISGLEKSLGMPPSGPSTAVDAQIADLKHQNELLRIEQEWQAERERHRTSVGKDPRPLDGCLAAIGGLWIAGLGILVTIGGVYLIGLPMAILGMG